VAFGKTQITHEIIDLKPLYEGGRRVERKNPNLE
jgi:hypothetical protein